MLLHNPRVNSILYGFHGKTNFRNHIFKGFLCLWRYMVDVEMGACYFIMVIGNPACHCFIYFGQFNIMPLIGERSGCKRLNGLEFCYPGIRIFSGYRLLYFDIKIFFNKPFVMKYRNIQIGRRILYIQRLNGICQSPP